jgi:peptidoglycan-N-acetylglucosamine deacetylase
VNILTFDIEEWFHILDNNTTKNETDWSLYETRIHSNMDRIFKLLEKRKQSATFFCLGWIAKKYPGVIRDIIKQGFEIGSHSFMHQLVYELKPDEFRKDLDSSIKILEDISGEKIKYYRAPGFSIREENAWAFEILAENGIEVDCSIFPAPRAHGGFPSYNSAIPSIIQYKGIKLKELPINYAIIANQPLIFSGGGYFRLFPYSMLKRLTSGSNYVMSYLHPRDFDTEQPMITGLSTLRIFKSYVGLSGSLDKLDRWISDFKFVDIRAAMAHIDWEKAPIVKVG